MIRDREKYRISIKEGNFYVRLLHEFPDTLFFFSKKIYTFIFRYCSWIFSRKLNYFLRILFTVQKIFRFLDINVFFFLILHHYFIFISTISIKNFFFLISFHQRISKYWKIVRNFTSTYRNYSFISVFLNVF